MILRKSGHPGTFHHNALSIVAHKNTIAANNQIAMSARVVTFGLLRISHLACEVLAQVDNQRVTV
jgi:hypothetical protein